MEHWMEKGSIIRTETRSSLGFLERGTSCGSKSAGMYLLRTLRSPILNYLILCMMMMCSMMSNVLLSDLISMI